MIDIEAIRARHRTLCDIGVARPNDDMGRLLAEIDHLLHPSQGEVVTYQSRIDELAAALHKIGEERDRHREASIKLLSLCDRMDGPGMERPAMIDTTTIRAILAWGGTAEVVE